MILIDVLKKNPINFYWYTLGLQQFLCYVYNLPIKNKKRWDIRYNSNTGLRITDLDTN